MSYSAAIGDLDNDGDPYLVVAHLNLPVYMSVSQVMPLLTIMDLDCLVLQQEAMSQPQPCLLFMLTKSIT